MRARRRMVALLALVVLVASGLGLAVLGAMPGRSHRGPLPPLTTEQRALADELRRDVERLAGEIGERNAFRPDALRAAREHVGEALRAAGLEPAEHEFEAAGSTFANVWAEIPGRERADEIVIVGAHYDTFPGSPGANDNATGVAALLALARRFAGREPPRTLRFVAFPNEEPPFFNEGGMGSEAFARRSRVRDERVVAMLSLETLGCYSDLEGSQRYPLAPLAWLYPTRGDFVGFVGDISSRSILRSAVGAFRESVAFPSEGACLPRGIPGVGWSDHRSFWRAGYPAVMVTDTALFRDPRYHGARDLPAAVDFERLARVVEGLEQVLVAWTAVP